MSTRKVKKIMIAFLAVMMLAVLSIFAASAASYTGVSKRFNVTNGGNTGYFNAKLTSTSSDTTHDVTSCTFTVSNGTGITTTSDKYCRGRYAYGRLVSCQKRRKEAPTYVRAEKRAD